MIPTSSPEYPPKPPNAPKGLTPPRLNHCSRTIWAGWAHRAGLLAMLAGLDHGLPNPPNR